MPVLQIMSDIHLEFFRRDANRFIEGLDPSGVDILVLAGDIDVGPWLEPSLRAFSARWPQVVYVPGNHEFYQSSPAAVREILTRLGKDLPNFTWLDNRVAVVSGVRFAGGTLWFSKPTGATWASRQGMNDYHVIRDFEPWVYDENQRCEAILRAKAKDTHVVVTHHIPTRHGIAAKYAGDPLNHYFCHDLTGLIEQAKPPLWVFGHTHTAMDFKVGDTRLICNPKGYPGEGVTTFNPRCLVEVNP